MAHFEFTDHAVERFRERHAPSLPHAEARAVLVELAPGAVPLREKTRAGTSMWQIGDPPMRLVTKHEAGVEVCVTVLPAGATFGVSAVVGDLSADEVIAAYERATAHLRPKPRPMAEQASTPPAPVEEALTLRQQIALRTQLGDLAVRCDALRKKNGALSAQLHKVEGRLRAANEKASKVPPPAAEPGPAKAKRIADHLALMTADRSKRGKVLRKVIALMLPRRTEPEFAPIVDLIEQLEPGLLDPEFWNRSAE